MYRRHLADYLEHGARYHRRNEKAGMWAVASALGGRRGASSGLLAIRAGNAASKMYAKSAGAFNPARAKSTCAREDGGRTDTLCHAKKAAAHPAKRLSPKEAQPSSGSAS